MPTFGSLRLFPTAAAMLQWSSLATAWLGGLGPSKEPPVKVKACVKVPKYPPMVTLYASFLKHSWFHLLPTAFSSSESDSSAVLSTSLGYSYTVWPEMLLLEGQSWAGQPSSVDVNPWGYRSGVCDTSPVTRASEGCPSLGEISCQPQGLQSSCTAPARGDGRPGAPKLVGRGGKAAHKPCQCPSASLGKAGFRSPA